MAHELPWLLEQIMISPACPDSAKVQQQLVDLLVDLKHFDVFMRKDSLKFELRAYHSLLLSLHRFFFQSL